MKVSVQRLYGDEHLEVAGQWKMNGRLRAPSWPQRGIGADACSLGL